LKIALDVIWRFFRCTIFSAFLLSRKTFMLFAKVDLRKFASDPGAVLVRMRIMPPLVGEQHVPSIPLTLRRLYLMLNQLASAKRVPSFAALRADFVA
jgi:hypothetical protein